MALSPSLTVAFLPWLEVREEIAIGPFKFWPFRKCASDKIKDQNIEKHLEQVFATYVQPRPAPDQKGQTVPVHEITVVTGDAYDLSTSLATELLNQARNALAFACIDACGEWNWCTSDNFELIQLRFFPGTSDIGYQGGEIARIRSFGWQLGEVLFQIPIYVNNHYMAKCDADLMAALSLAVSNANETETQTVLRALDYFVQACKNSGDVTREMRIVLMALGFEIILDLCDHTPRQDFRPKIHRFCGDSSEPTRPYEIVDDRDGHIIATEQLTHKQIWAEEFYKLRNRIVHGRQLSKDDFVFRGQSHFKIATLFFRICVRKRLEEIAHSNYRCTETIRQNSEGEFEFNFW
jgi:Apea-like HEPN